MKVTFQPSGQSVVVLAGTTVMAAAQELGLHINASCGGTGVCGKCQVEVSAETEAAGQATGLQLACGYEVQGDVTITLPGDTALVGAIMARHRARARTYSIDELREAGIFHPPIEKYFLELPRPSAGDNMSDGARLTQALKSQYGRHRVVVPLAILRKLRKVLRADDFRVTVTVALPVREEQGKSFVMNVQPGNWVERNFGLAFDLGTTTVHGQLIDLHSGKVLVEEGEYNRQMSYGEDVISRIIQAEKEDGLALMQQLAAKSINLLISRMLKATGIGREEISSLTLAANTTMTHLLLGLEPDNIRRAPYVPVSTLFAPLRAQDIGLELAAHAVALVYPAISSYVGGDIVAGVMGAGMHLTEKLSLFIDIGTNAEIVIGNRDWLVCAACSAGPAFEGGGIRHGMRAAAGAIVDFSLAPDSLEPMVVTIGQAAPAGICGSGLLIVVAALFSRGVLDHRGKFNRDMAGARLREGSSGWEYVLVLAGEAGIVEDIVITEVDIDNLIRTKAAIFAGVKTLIEEVGLATTDIEEVILAGGFGSFVDLDAAITIGLLPEMGAERVNYIGNGSLLGARMSGLSNHIRQDVLDVVGRMTSFELSEVPSYHEQYVASLFLPHTDMSLFPGVAGRLSDGQGEKKK
ncbi:MAG: ASKHA domain-containing protein [Thermodesulfobacteriota bacterium]